LNAPLPLALALAPVATFWLGIVVEMAVVAGLPLALAPFPVATFWPLSPLAFATTPIAVLELPLPVAVAVLPKALLELLVPLALEPKPVAVLTLTPPAVPPLALALSPRAVFAALFVPVLEALALVPQATFLTSPDAVAPAPVCGSAPVVLPPHTNCACAEGAPNEHATAMAAEDRSANRTRLM
jgi:hypothetical protein